MLIAIFGIDGGAIGLVINLLVLFLIVVYLALIYWTYLDATPPARGSRPDRLRHGGLRLPLHRHRHLHDPAPAGVPRGPGGARAGAARRGAAPAPADRAVLPHCEYPIAANYLRCPNCERRLRNPCRKCRKPLDPKWGVCPFCETEVRKRAPRSRRRAERPARRTSSDRVRTATGRLRESARHAAGLGAPFRRVATGSRRVHRSPPSGRSAAQERPPRPSGGRSSRPNR